MKTILTTLEKLFTYDWKLSTVSAILLICSPFMVNPKERTTDLILIMASIFIMSVDHKERRKYFEWAAPFEIFAPYVILIILAYGLKALLGLN